MTGPHDPERQYSDSEVRLLLDRAARMQGQSRTGVAGQGLTLTQLEEIAAEAQIDVLTLRAAARELDIETTERPNGAAARLAGAPMRIVVERTLPFEVDADALGGIVASIHAVVDDRGNGGGVGRTFTWHSESASGRKLEVRVSVQGATQVSIEERYSEVASGLFAGVIGGVGIGGGLGVGTALASMLGSAAVAVAFPVAIIGISYASCRAGYSAWIRSRRRTLHALCDRIVQDLTR